MRGPTYNLPFNRRREQRTDFKKRLALVKSGKPRLVVRRSHNNFIVQMIDFDMNGDMTKVSSNSLELKKFGWNAHTGNTPAAYLAGYLCGLRATKNGVKEAVLDIGLHNNVKGSSIFAVLKGIIDAGVDVPHSEDNIPNEDRITGKHIQDYGKAKGASEIVKNFENVKSKIESELK